MKRIERYPAVARTAVLSLALALLTLALLTSGVLAHPGSGIAADRRGNVYFLDTGSGVWKLSPDGTLTRVPGPAYHWMAIDEHDRLRTATLPSFDAGGATVLRAGSDPTILLSSDFPVAVGPDGSLYYPWAGGHGPLRIFRMDTAGVARVLATLSADPDSVIPRWVNGAGAGPDGSLYYTEDAAVRRISPGGVVTTVVAGVALPGCGAVPGVDRDDGPYLRGLAVDAAGSVYVAATGCGAVLKISADGDVKTVLSSPAPWAPTAVAVSGTDLFVLEYLHTQGDDRREWIPRVRKMTPDGRAVTVATIAR